MNQPKKIKVVSEEILARASQLHDEAFADPKLENKPAWEDSIRQAEEQLAPKKDDSETA